MSSLSLSQLLPYQPLVIFWRKDGQKPASVFWTSAPPLISNHNIVDQVIPKTLIGGLLDHREATGPELTFVNNF